MTKLNREEFKIFLMIYAAHVDYIYSKEEEELIRSKTCTDTYQKMYDLFIGNNDYTSLKIILENKKEHLNNTNDKTYYFNLIKNVFESDGDYARIEKSFSDFFERILVDQKI